MEQLYPLRMAALEAVFEKYRDGTPVVWVQEEPANMGGLNYMRIRFAEKLLGRFPLSDVSRAPSATPASGSPKRHKHEQSEIIQRAFSE
jgi:2-oxoglutarate dehydrogenase E1 component